MTSKSPMTGKEKMRLKEERYMQNLSEEERKLYEECLALLQGIGEIGGLEEACELLERYVESKKGENGR